MNTWTQDLRRHLHVHALMACGALAGDQQRWVEPKRARNFLFPVHALSRVFRGKFLHALQQAGDAGVLPREPSDTATARQQRVKALHRHAWVVYAKTPLAGPAPVLDYLSRYTHRTAIGNERLMTIADDTVLLRVRADATGGKRTIALRGEQFIGPAATECAPVLDYLSRYTHRTAIGNERLMTIADDKVLLRVRADATGGKRTIALRGERFIGPAATACAAAGLQAYPSLRAAGTGGQDRAAGAGATVARDAGGQPASARGRAVLHAPPVLAACRGPP